MDRSGAEGQQKPPHSHEDSLRDTQQKKKSPRGNETAETSKTLGGMIVVCVILLLYAKSGGGSTPMGRLPVSESKRGKRQWN